MELRYDRINERFYIILEEDLVESLNWCARDSLDYEIEDEVLTLYKNIT